MRLRVQFGIYLYECVLKKVSNGQKFTGSKFVIKTSPQCNSIGTTPEPSLTCNLKVANKDCFFFANYSASFSDNCISSFLDSVHSPLFFRKFMEIDRFTLRAATIYLGFLSNLLSRLPPPT